jgi:hypothetical protein
MAVTTPTGKVGRNLPLDWESSILNISAFPRNRRKSASLSGRNGSPIFRTLVASLRGGPLGSQIAEGAATEGSHGRRRPLVRFRGLFCLHRRAERVPFAVHSFLCHYARAVKWLKPLPCLSRMTTRSRARPVRASQKSSKGQSVRLAQGVRNMRVPLRPKDPSTRSWTHTPDDQEVSARQKS